MCVYFDVTIYNPLFIQLMSLQVRLSRTLIKATFEKLLSKFQDNLNFKGLFLACPQIAHIEFFLSNIGHWPHKLCILSKFYLANYMHSVNDLFI